MQEISTRRFTQRGQAARVSAALKKMIGRISNFLSQETKSWFPYEKQIHDLLLSDSAFEAIREVLRSQIDQFHHATRGFDKNMASATFSYERPMLTWDESADRMLMAEVIAGNGQGRVFSGSGMLASIEIEAPKLGVARGFILTNPRLTNQVPRTQRKQQNS